ncbi:VOC family protein [Salinigranum salinum]|uniref:VOC family protein n=1 Tax=Salinigranum salinum TaxID=1364937 RepID=UPI0012607C94|nr:VOC family protein [Salinigranum salinum]
MTTHANPEEANPLPNGTRIGRTALRVADLDELTEFYRAVVGLEVLRTGDTASVLGSDGTPLLVLEGEEALPARHRSRAGLYHNAFRVPSREALGDALARVRDRWHLGGASDHWVSEALYLTDPEGNGIEIYRDFPRDEWPITEEGRVRISTEPLDLTPIEAAATGDSTVPPGTDIGHVHLEVSSLEDFREFYVETLGFELQTSLPAASFVSAGGYHHHIGANTWHHRTTPNDGRGLAWVELVVPDTATLDAVRDRLATREIPIADRNEGIEVTGPDGITIRLQVESSNRLL